MVTPREAEVAAENYWIQKDCITRRALRTKWAKVDFFGADVMGKAQGFSVWCQVTTAQRVESVRRRRRKLEEIPWLVSDRVFVFELEMRPNPVRRSRIDYFFRVHEYAVFPGRRVWQIWPDPIPLTREMFKVGKRAPGVAGLAADKTRREISQGRL